MKVSLQELLKAGVHFGHRPRYWNPKMAPYIFGVRNDLHIIDLQKTQAAMNKTLNLVAGVAAQGGNVMIVGTKISAQSLVEEYANSCNMPFVNRRWLGGMLTNYKTIKLSVKRLKDLEYQVENADLTLITKKERLKMYRELNKLNASLGGVKDMKTLPDLLIVIDVQQEKIAIEEAKKLGIPVVGIVDTNSDPDGVEYVVPGNDDSMKAIKFYLETFSKTIYAAQEELRAIAEKNAAKIVVKAEPKAVAEEKASPKTVAEKKAAPKAAAEKKAAPKAAAEKKAVPKAAAEKKAAPKAAAEKKAAPKAAAEKKAAPKAAVKKRAAPKAAVKKKD